MKAGRLRHRGAIQHSVVGSPQYSASGQLNAEWANLDDGDGLTWMSIEPLRGRELLAAQEHASEVEVRIRVRYRDDVTDRMRVLHEGKYYEIQYIIDPETRHVELELMCSQGVLHV